MGLNFLTLVIANTYMWFGGQGYCTFDFALHESNASLSNLELVLRPEYVPSETASGQTHLDDAIIKLDQIGGAHVNWDNSARIETDCSVSGFDLIKATAFDGSKTIDLLKEGMVSFDTYKPIDLKLKGKKP